MSIPQISFRHLLSSIQREDGPDSKAPPAEDEFEDYVCVETADKPWAAGYDFNDDGYVKVDDMKAAGYGAMGLGPVDESMNNVFRYCKNVKTRMLATEVQLKLVTVLTRYIFKQISSKAALDEISKIKKDAIKRWKKLSIGYTRWNSPKMVMSTLDARSSIIEMTSRATALVNSTKKMRSE